MRNLLLGLGLAVAVSLTACETTTKRAESGSHRVLLDGKTHTWFVGSVYDNCETIFFELAISYENSARRNSKT
jgi:beta-lactamase class D